MTTVNLSVIEFYDVIKEYNDNGFMYFKPHEFVITYLTNINMKDKGLDYDIHQLYYRFLFEINEEDCIKEYYGNDSCKVKTNVIKNKIKIFLRNNKIKKIKQNIDGL